MKYIDEFRDGDLARNLAASIAAEADATRRYHLMEFCGGHTHAISRYGVADLSALAGDTHRFEARHLDGLVGPWPEQRALYAARSPLNHAERMSCPVIFFQGLEDVVVPPEQTERMAEALRHKGIPVEVRQFPEEGHGFRKGSTQIEVLEATEAFFRTHFAL